MLVEQAASAEASVEAEKLRSALLSSISHDLKTPLASILGAATSLRSYGERFAKSEDPESFDKEYVRRYLAKLGFKGDGPIPPIPDDVKVEATRRYIEAYETITGEAFVPDLSDPMPRLRKNLGLA